MLLRDKAKELLQAMRPVAEMLNVVHDEDCYTDSLDSQLQLAYNPRITPAARMLEEMHEKQASFFEFAQHKSLENRQYFLERRLAPDQYQAFKHMAVESLRQQQALENIEEITFDDFLQAYFDGRISGSKN